MRSFGNDDISDRADNVELTTDNFSESENDNET